MGVISEDHDISPSWIAGERTEESSHVGHGKASRQSYSLISLCHPLPLLSTRLFTNQTIHSAPWRIRKGGWGHGDSGAGHIGACHTLLASGQTPHSGRWHRWRMSRGLFHAGHQQQCRRLLEWCHCGRSCLGDTARAVISTRKRERGNLFSTFQQQESRPERCREALPLFHLHIRA